MWSKTQVSEVDNGVSMPVSQLQSNPSKSTFGASKFPWKADALLPYIISENYHYSSALADLQRNSGVLSEGFALGNRGLGLWQPRSAISVWLLSGEEDSSDFPARNEALHPHCATTSV